MIPIAQLAVRSSLALAIVLLLSSALAQAGGVAPGGTCAATARRDLCAAGACSDEIGKARTRFGPEDVGADDSGDDIEAAPPEAADFSGPGTCADPSVGCGNPRAPRTVASNPQSQPPTPDPKSGPPAAPITPDPPAPPVPPAPPAPPVVASPPPPPPGPPATPDPPTPPPPPTVVEPPPTPVLPPGVPQP